jgi:hypothetical protein
MLTEFYALLALGSFAAAAVVAVVHGGGGHEFPVIVDDDQATGYTAYGALGFPNLHLIGADGTVIARTSGELDLESLSAFVSQP